MNAVFETDGLTPLEASAVVPTMARQYQDELDRFFQYAHPRGLDVSEENNLDRLLLDYMNRKYLHGHQSYRLRTDRLMAALLHRYPEFGSLGSQELSRSWRGLKNFRKRTRRLEGLRVGRLRGPISYARPSELLRARICS